MKWASPRVPWRRGPEAPLPVRQGGEGIEALGVELQNQVRLWVSHQFSHH